MSLKALHVVFVVVSTLLSAVFAWWAFDQYQGGAGGTYLLVAAAAVLAGVSLIVYGRWFLKKLKHVSYL